MLGYAAHPISEKLSSGITLILLHSVITRCSVSVPLGHSDSGIVDAQGREREPVSPAPDTVECQHGVDGTIGLVAV